jgi:hypothetical protein
MRPSRFYALDGISTLRRHVEALGGRLEVTAVVGDKRVVLDV